MAIVRKHNGSLAKLNTHRTIKYSNYKNFDQEQFCEDLETAPWSILDITNDPNEKLSFFEQIYTNVLNEHAPLIEKRVKTLRQPPWFNDTIAEAIKERDMLNLANKTRDGVIMTVQTS